MSNYVPQHMSAVRIRTNFSLNMLWLQKQITATYSQESSHATTALFQPYLEL